MSSFDKSIKLVTNEFTKSIAEVPLEVMYQTILADQYNINGFQFNIKQPGQLALLDTDIWIRYRLVVQETAAANNSITNLFEQQALNVANTNDLTRVAFPSSDHKLALRAGNVMQRGIQNFQVMINNKTISVQPYRWIDVLNRLYISNDMSEHEFSASGGRFDEGNHGTRTSHSLRWRDRQNPITTAVDGGNAGNRLYKAPYVSQGWAAISPAAAAVLTDDTTSRFRIESHWSYHTNNYIDTNAHALKDFPPLNLKPDFPLSYEFYNPGFDRRVSQFINMARRNFLDYNGGDDMDAAYRSEALVDPAALAVTGAQFKSYANLSVGGQHVFHLDIFERLPCPLFKMYSNDEVFGVIPNITMMQIQGNFLSTLKESIFRSSDEALGIDLNFATEASRAELYLRWYTPPQTMSIPREITIPYKKIAVWSKTQNLPLAPNAGANVQAFQTVNIAEYNISLEAIPDLLLIYLKYNPSLYKFTVPDDYNAELTNFTLNIDNSSGKMNQVQSLDLYLKWKKLLKHSDNKIIGYDEWRKYCCVAALQPEDYGVRYGPGYSNQTTIGITATAKVWASRNPSIMFQAGEIMPNNADYTNALELEVVSIYNRNCITIRADGSATEELLRVAADFGLGMPNMAAVPPSDIRGALVAPSDVRGILTR